MDDNSSLNSAVEIHDSTLVRIEHTNDQIVAILKAYIHKSAGRPGKDRGTGWSQVIHFRFGKGKATGNVSGIPMELVEGRLTLSGETLSNVIRVPLRHVGPSRMELESLDETKLVIEGESVTGELVGSPVYIEEFEP